MLKNKRIRIRVIVVVFALVAFVLIGLKLNNNFKSDIIAFSQKMTQQGSSDGPGGVSIGSVYFEEGGSSKQVLAHVKPGGKYDGQLYIVNTKDVPAVAELKMAPFNCSDAKNEECSKRKAFDPQYFEFVDLENTMISLDPNEIKIVDFSINPPLSYEEGQYFASITSIDQEKQKVQQGGSSFDAMSAYAIPLQVDVTNKAADFKYTKLIDDPRDLAFQNMLISLRIYGSIFLAALALIFVYRSYKKT